MSAVDRLRIQGLIEEEVPLGPLTTYKSGGPARLFARPRDLGDLKRISEVVVELRLPVLVIGRGSNLVVSDRGFEGIVVHIAGGFDDVSYDGLNVDAGAGVPLPILARGSVKAGIAGLEFFVGVPGSVGGAVRQNAGCFGVETKDRLVLARIIDLSDGSEFDADPSDLELSYRHSVVRPEWVVVSARFSGTSSDTANSRDELKQITRWRKDNQPGGTFNAGSVYKNPDGDSAGAIIERAGLKGLSIGEVSVSTKHANFFVAGPGASSDDIRALVVEVGRRVLDATGIELEPEIQMVGFE